MKNTPQRMKIVEFLKKHKGCPTAIEVYEGIRENMPGITLATVYRTLNRMYEEKNISKVMYDKNTRFDPNKYGIYMICKICGNIAGIYEKGFKERIEKIALEKNYRIEKIQIIIEGICNKCLMK